MAGKKMQVSVKDEVEAALAWLKDHSTQHDRDNLVKFAINPTKAAGLVGRLHSTRTPGQGVEAALDVDRRQKCGQGIERKPDSLVDDGGPPSRTGTRWEAVEEIP